MDSDVYRDPEYLKDLCSKRAIQDKQNGVLAEYYSAIRQQVNDNELKRFAELTTDAEKLLFVWQLDVVHQLTIQTSKKDKDANLSEKKRKEGNQRYAKEEFHQAKDLYTQAIILAPTPDISEEESTLSLALSNRAACWLHLNETSLCLQDTEESIKRGYPQELLYKAHERRAKALTQLGRMSEAITAYSLAIKALHSSNLDNKRRSRLEQDFGRERRNTQKLKQNKTLALITSNIEDEEYLPEVVYGVNPLLPSASTAIKIQETNKQGRFCVAAKPIKPGDTLIVEKPVVSCLLPQYYKNYCFQCLQRLSCPYPCLWCARVSFCSPSCRDAACSTHHVWECNLLDYLYSSGMSITCIMSLRLITDRKLQFFTSKKDVLEKYRDTYSGVDLFATDPEEDWNGYLPGYSLVTHMNEISSEDYLHRTVACIYMMKCLKSVGYFKDENQNPLNKDSDATLTEEESLIASLLLRHIHILQFNAHEITTCQTNPEGKAKGSKPLYIGGGLFPTLALLNHGCEPGIMRCFVEGNTLTVKSIKSLRVGEEVEDNYGPAAATAALKQRREHLLTRFWFHCECIACRENWPSFSDLQPENMRIKCQECGHILGEQQDLDLNSVITCEKCTEKTDLPKTLKKLKNSEITYKEGVRCMEQDNVEDALSHFEAVLHTLHTTIASPHKDILIAEEAARQAMTYLGSYPTKENNFL